DPPPPAEPVLVPLLVPEPLLPPPHAASSAASAVIVCKRTIFVNIATPPSGARLSPLEGLAARAQSGFTSTSASALPESSRISADPGLPPAAHTRSAAT